MTHKIVFSFFRLCELLQGGIEITKANSGMVLLVLDENPDTFPQKRHRWEFQSDYLAQSGVGSMPNDIIEAACSIVARATANNRVLWWSRVKSGKGSDRLREVNKFLSMFGLHPIGATSLTENPVDWCEGIEKANNSAIVRPEPPYELVSVTMKAVVYYELRKAA